MAEEILLPNGGSTGGSPGWQAGGTATNLWDGINNGTTSPDDAEFDDITGGSVEGTVLTLDLTASAIEDSDTVTNVTIKVRADGVDADDAITVNFAPGGSAQTAVSQAITTSPVTYTLNDATWNADRTAAEMDGAQVLITNEQAGMPTASTWTIYEVEVVVTFTEASSFQAAWAGNSNMVIQ